MNNSITLNQYIALPSEIAAQKKYSDACFEIPKFQRGYIWGKASHKKEEQNPVEYLVQSILEKFPTKADLFLQGITYSVHTDNEQKKVRIVIIDGQQRTTFFYLLLKFLGYNGSFMLKYTIREDSNTYLQDLGQKEIENLLTEDANEPIQDIFFFKRTLLILKKMIPLDKKEDLAKYVLHHVRFLCVEISKDQEESIFTMMNGNKSLMRSEELIKAELLRRASIHTPEIKKIESQDIRGRMAREWDTWLHWWNQSSVSDFFLSSQYILGWLLPLILNNERVSFENFQKTFDVNQINTVKEAKEKFRKMRLKQRQLQDAYYNPLTYNYIGAILRMCAGNSERFTFLRWFFSDNSSRTVDELRRYFDLSIIGVNHKAIIENDRSKIQETYNAFKDALSDPMLYVTNYERCARWLLRCNILEDCRQTDSDANFYQQGRKFNFKIWNNRSLEHIYPKSKFGHKDETGRILGWNDKEIPSCEIYREGSPEISEHSIGNLVLLYGSDNSTFGAKTFEQKKSDYFSVRDGARHFESRHLIHTISVFASSKWDRLDIHQRYEDECANLEESYKSYLTPTQDHEQTN
jgi:uncharacterized protein with ParB-like and HNH nuclease domain